MSEDWDILIILDGCRYDAFEEVNWLPGRLESRVSVASDSWEFITQNFNGKQYHDTVYITANPFVNSLKEGVFHNVIQLLAEWDEEIETVPPETVVDAALKALSQFPHKRVIVHMMQPHYPFLGELGRQLDHRGHSRSIEGRYLSNTDEQTIWDRLRDDEVDRSVVWDAYFENTEIAINYAEEIVSEADGNVVLSADHGNLFGEILLPIPIREYGHPRGVRSTELNRVPWFVVDGSERRKTYSEAPVSQSHNRIEEIDSKLEALGYLDQ
jgi:hypothetical protein